MSRLKVHTSGMLTSRAVLAAIIALWIAILPVVGVVAFVPQSSDVAMSDDSGMPCNKPMDDGKAFTKNPCLRLEYNWAAATGRMPALYITLRYHPLNY